ncbi:3-deoxy-manno-octulosonate cytidylyltransferase [Pararhodospirillum oryzae]|uniref:3-deoxy-manno-octulosonate cytidylyltransferase n=1 Tax=Pararhodospirillum oryzae TaxID=478448 RepID=A0A512HBY2_9PROT|nr:3-deoxy-manno-octulosonate cytidylyltransferase [Pararhodospirillum oryzae]GEO82955.1 3-deoxy-manno-octulosonate cytidylyltransferase [Pararhodospirillum oryzae]
MTRPILVIPARLAATRLPGKPLADIAGEPMIVHVWRRACEADLGPVLVAAGDPAIVEAIAAVGGRAVLTDPDLPSGSDRVWQALTRADPDGHHDVIVNIQGDLPTLEPAVPRATLAALHTDPAIDLATPVCAITRPEELGNPNVVKAVAGFAPGASHARALYFSRACVPTGEGPVYHHIGLYAWRRAALCAFVSWPPGVLERRERLEQLRALEHHLRIEAALVDTVPLGVDTQDDLERARAALGRTA